MFGDLFQDFSDVCERESTDNELSADNVIELSKSSRKAFTIIMGCFCIYNCERVVKDWWWMVFTPDK